MTHRSNRSLLFLMSLFALSLAVLAIGLKRTPTSTSDPTNSAPISVEPTNAPSTTATNNPPQVEVMYTSLYSGWETEVLSPGWLAVEARVFRSKDDHGTLASGQRIPNNYVSKSWYRLNGEELVVESGAEMIDLNGIVVQRSVFYDGIARNLTTDEQWSQDPHSLSLDDGFSGLLGKPEPWYESLEVTNLVVRDTDARRFIASTNRTTISITLASQTGQPLEHCTEVREPDRSIVSSSCSYLEKVVSNEPPGWILGAIGP